MLSIFFFESPLWQRMEDGEKHLCVKLYIFTSYFKQSVKVYFEGLLRFLRDFYAF